MWQFAGGVVTGGALVYLYYRFGNKAAQLGRELLQRAQNDIKVAEMHVRSFTVR
jgi:hypothetical protein